jgi:tetratricopeptide (TPR) repeat protein
MSVKIWEENITMPSYGVGHMEKNPMFFEKRVYQGNSGVVYPNPVIEKIYDEKVDKAYHALFIENKYLKVMILPELGGRLHMAYDKINNRHMVYYNQVIKPALVGVTGPWVSGGIEINFPTHHRPSGFESIDYTLEENTDGSKTIWVNEIERMYRLKGMAGFTLYPDKDYIEISIKLYNRTQFPQSFLWWANAAVNVDENFQAIFPPDVTAVYDHGRRDVTKFPIATGEYYKQDYSEGVDISWYKNVIVPTSYMVEESDYDFIGGYDYKVKAGMFHVANHHIAPGKKFFSWGISDFSRAWEKQLTDDDGSYLELMAGVSSNNQPDLSWLNPYEEKSYSQYFMPYKDLGVIKNANTDACIGLDKYGSSVTVKVYVTGEFNNLTVSLKDKDNDYILEKINLNPQTSYIKTISLNSLDNGENLVLRVLKENGSELISYAPEKNVLKPMLEAAKPAPLPSEITTTEQLYLTALHLEQYRHATFEPVPYYLEAIKRDTTDIRNNNGYGLWLLRRGQFEKSEKYFRQAITTLTERNPNPNYTEPFYNLGLALKYQGKFDEAYKMLYKSVWTSAGQDIGYYTLAQIDMLSGEFLKALDHIDRSLIKNYHNHKAWHLKSAILRKLNRIDEAIRVIDHSIEIDAFNFGVLFEKYFVLKESNNIKATTTVLEEIKKLMRNYDQNYIEFALDYVQSGLYDEAFSVLNTYVDENKTQNTYPLVYYVMGYSAYQSGDQANAEEYFVKASEQNPDCCFPHQLELIAIMETAMKVNPKDSKAPYYLGNLFYDKSQFDEAILLWQKSSKLEDSFPTVHRNLALAYFNKESNPTEALEELEKAFYLNTSDHRIFMELDQLYKKTGVDAKRRIELLEKYPDALEYRDDLYLELVTLYNQIGEYEKSYKLITKRKFHPWEANEGKVGAQWMLCLRELGRQEVSHKNFGKAISLLDVADASYPDNVGEGKLPNLYENDIHYYLGLAYEGLGETEKAAQYFKQASEGAKELGMAMFYYDQPAHNLFYQGLANKKLGLTAKAKSCFNKLVDFGEANLSKEVKINYFAIQLADTLIFKNDMNMKNKAHCHFLMGLGYLGLGEKQKAKENFKKVLEVDKNHQEALIHINFE